MKDRTPSDAGFYLDEYDAPRFWQHVDFNGGMPYVADRLARAVGECWNWNGEASPQGKAYGRHRVFGSWQQAHRLAWLDHGHKIPTGFEVDHLCRNTRCVNPQHLEPVTHAENMRRGKLGAIEACKRGHAFTPDNTHIQRRGDNTVRVCKACRYAWHKYRYELQKAARA
jgi:hypothetical protein